MSYTTSALDEIIQTRGRIDAERLSWDNLEYLFEQYGETDRLEYTRTQRATAEQLVASGQLADIGHPLHYAGGDPT
jgi:hypothetical protein